MGRTAWDNRKPHPGDILIDKDLPDKTKQQLRDMSYNLVLGTRTSGPINAIFFDEKHNSFGAAAAIMAKIMALGGKFYLSWRFGE